MKKSKFLFLSALLMTVCLISFSSCSDDDDDTPPAPPVVNPMVGTWKVTAQECVAEVKPASLKEAIEEYLEDDAFGEGLPKRTLALSEDGKYVSTLTLEGDETVEERGVYEYKDDKLTLTPSKVQPREMTGEEEELETQVFEVKLNTSGFALSQDGTAEAKEELEEAEAWEAMGIEKPEGFELVKSTRVSTFGIVPQPK